MLVVSNHAYDTIGSPADAVIRLNLAWMKNRDEAERTLANLRGHQVYLDYPRGRSKPPKPVVTLDEAISLANKYVEVKFFAVSNIESPLTILGVKALLPSTVEIVPKIETKRGVMHLKEIVEKTKCKYIMLDKEDLYTDVGQNADQYDSLVTVTRDVVKSLGVTLLELQGVIFA